MTAVEIYQKGMEEVKRALVQVRQFIRLFDEENFPNGHLNSEEHI